MKILFIFPVILTLSVVCLDCAGTQSPDPEVVACKAKCNTTYDTCVKKSRKNMAKKAACEAVKNKCLSDCESGK